MDNSGINRYINKRLKRSGSCLLWTGPIDAHGYGYIQLAPEDANNGSVIKIHRYIWERDIGPIPPGMTIDHVRDRGCTNKNCVDTDHIEVVTRAENSRRNTCKHGCTCKKHNWPKKMKEE